MGLALTVERCLRAIPVLLAIKQEKKAPNDAQNHCQARMRGKKKEETGGENEYRCCYTGRRPRHIRRLTVHCRAVNAHGANTFLNSVLGW